MNNPKLDQSLNPKLMQCDELATFHYPMFSRAADRKDSTPRYGRLLHPSSWAERDSEQHKKTLDPKALKEHFGAEALQPFMRESVATMLQLKDAHTGKQRRRRCNSGGRAQRTAPDRPECATPQSPN